MSQLPPKRGVGGGRGGEGKDSFVSFGSFPSTRLYLEPAARTENGDPKRTPRGFLRPKPGQILSILTAVGEDRQDLPHGPPRACIGTPARSGRAALGLGPRALISAASTTPPPSSSAAPAAAAAATTTTAVAALC